MIIAQRQTPGNASAPMAFEHEAASRTAHSGTFRIMSEDGASERRRLSSPGDIVEVHPVTPAQLQPRQTMPTDHCKPNVKKTLELSPTDCDQSDTYPMQPLTPHTKTSQISLNKSYPLKNNAEKSTMSNLLRRRRRLYWTLLAVACLTIGVGCTVIAVVVNSRRKE